MGRKGAQEEAVAPRPTGSGLPRAGTARALGLLAGETILSAAPDQADPDGAVRLDFWWSPHYIGTWNYELIAGPLAVTSAPAMTVWSDALEIAVAGPDSSLSFYWAWNGTPTWHAEQIDGAGSSEAAPAIADTGNAVFVIATNSSGSSVMYYGAHGGQIHVVGWDAVPPACQPTAPAETFFTYPEVASTYSC